MEAPPLPILWALVACLLVPFVLLALSRVPFRIPQLGRRFAGAWLLVLLCWLSASLALGPPGGFRWEDYVAGLMIFGAAVLCSFMLWSVLCWGVTLNMLLTLTNRNGAASMHDWIVDYLGAHGLERLAIDRVKVLFALRLAVPQSGQQALCLTRFGALVARFAGFASRALAIRA